MYDPQTADFRSLAYSCRSRFVVGGMTPSTNKTHPGLPVPKGRLFPLPSGLRLPWFGDRDTRPRCWVSVSNWIDFGEAARAGR